ncbi:hypothetical protein ASPZODRAFT_127654 [Penicilliopsis zonata CBS 506.65]|uniref:Uncharacterized protein n=1 Tax=Penicilliopsis zonata CBS 506.65 TaxID=1073090 RepID=A0A1L9SWY5_9EURO|nr:hypothetical protein ASPZODRAFT_127654 [Penicilliopsis zonata CBS 506.65]OJJ51563.1 hypothetical protein ASPZODRAFT_127654 [Penicilliopsis zonata CBS 506.65]
MSTPDRDLDRPYSTRRSNEPYGSPFRRARLESRVGSYTDASRIPSPSPKQGTRSRRQFGQTRTLRGAFEAASRAVASPMSMSDGDQLAQTTPSPHRRRPRVNSWKSPGSDASAPPRELAESYQRINDAFSLSDLVEQEDQSQLEETRKNWGGGNNRDLFDLGVGFADEIHGEPRPTRLADHARDEQRLRRATSSRSPVFSRAQMGAQAALTAENLQRRDGEINQQKAEDGGGHEPSLNLPRSWGSRGRNLDWLNSIDHQAETGSPDVNMAPRASYSKFGAEIDSNTRSLQPTDQSQGGKQSEKFSHHRTRTASTSGKAQVNDSYKDTAEGNAIPDTPIVIYKNSTFNRPSPSKRDSQDLLRKLARVESPNQVKTPEPQKPTEWHIYDKTPVVTGAWVDTPITERREDRIMKEAEPTMQAISEEEVQQQQEEEQQKPETGSSIDNKPQPTPQDPPSKPEKQTESQEPVPAPKDVKKQPPKKRAVIKPTLPKSALETIIKAAKSDKDLDLGDDTIESLQQLLLEEEAPSKLKTEEEEDEAYKQAILAKLGSPPLNDSEMADFDRLDAKLLSLARGMEEVKQGMNNLGVQVSHYTSSLTSPTVATNKKNRTNGGSSCHECGAGSNNLQASSIRLPRLWTRNQPTGRTRPTRLGWATLIFTAWLLTESTMCDLYCHPNVSTVCKGNCLRPDAPDFPFVLPIMLWRWSRLSNILAPLFAVFVACGRLIAQLLGIWDGYVEDVPRRPPNLTAGEIRLHGTVVTQFPAVATANVPVKEEWLGQRQSTDGWEDYQYSMEDDEIL